MGIKLSPPTTPPPQPAPAPLERVLNSPRARELSKLLADALNAEEENLSGRQYSTDTLADVIAISLTAYEASVKRRLKPNVQKQGFDPLWSDKTYEMVTDRGSEGIKCLRCEKVSFHPKDIENRYCGNCQEFHDG
jgi:hypothetical protein